MSYVQMGHSALCTMKAKSFRVFHGRFGVKKKPEQKTFANNVWSVPSFT